MDSRHNRLTRLLRLGLIALMVYFSQVYPYIHFHHAHAESDTPVDINVHPVDVEPYHSHHGHHDSPHPPGDTHHHHQDFEQHVDWHLIRTHASSVLSHADVSYVSVQSAVGATETSFRGRCRVISKPLPESVPIEGLDSRGPPALA